MADNWLHAAARAIWPAAAPPRPLRPHAAYAAQAPKAVVVLQTGPNASVDYYLRPRLETDTSRPWAVVDLATQPSEIPLLRQDGVWVVICRYINAPWIEALKAASPRLCGVSFFVDDDLPAMMTERGSPLEARVKVATRYARFVDDLESVVSEIWASTPALARHFDGPVRLLRPVPFEAPKRPLLDQAPLVVYHGTLTHTAERAFLRQVAARLDRAATPLRLEVTGGLATRMAWASLRKSAVRPQRAWRDYLREQHTRSAAILLAPLADSRVNRARANVKSFDAARLGAVGLFADCAPYADTVIDGVDGRLLPMDPDIWAEAILQVLNDPGARVRMAQAAFERVSAARASIDGLFDGLHP